MNHRAIAIIPARGGSTRIPLKNMKIFHGIPIIAYSIEVAKKSGMFEEVYVSTDSVKIAEIAKSWGAKVIDRPCALAQNEVGTQEVVRDAIQAVGAELHDLVCCIYPTAPMLTAHDLMLGRMAMNRHDAIFAFTVGAKPLRDAGMFYFGRPWAFWSGAKLFDQHSIMIPIDESRCVDINTPEDWSKAEKMYSAWKAIK